MDMKAKRPADRLRTPLTDLPGIDVPTVQSGMRQVAGPELAAGVSRAGGLGILAGLPFGVNLWLHHGLQPPPDLASCRTSCGKGG